MSIDWEKPLEIEFSNYGQTELIRNATVLLKPRDGSDFVVVASLASRLVFCQDGTYLFSFDEKDTWKHDFCVIRNKEEKNYDATISFTVDEDYKNALSITTAELEKQKKLMEEIKDLQEQINELKTKEPHVPYRYPEYPYYYPYYYPTTVPTYPTSPWTEHPCPITVYTTTSNNFK